MEVENKNVKSTLEKMTDTYKNWHEKLPMALWGYRTSIRTSMEVILYSLVHTMEVVLLVEVKIPFLCVLVECEVSNFDWLRESTRN